MSIESAFELAAMRAAGRVVAATLHAVAQELKAGVTTRELDDVARREFARHGARSGPQIVFGYPGAICISVNEEAVHGIPGNRVIKPGDMVTIDVTAELDGFYDVTAELDGFYADAAVTHLVEPVGKRARALKACAEAAFQVGAAQARCGAAVWKIGEAVEREVRRRGFRVLRGLCGHGIGRSVHEEPQIPNYLDPTSQDVLTENLVITIEPIVAATTSRSRLLRDGWTIVSSDGGLTAHHEHTMVIQRGEPLILTAA
jgi:methionyl aminopeptidase